MHVLHAECIKSGHPNGDEMGQSVRKWIIRITINYNVKPINCWAIKKYHHMLAQRESNHAYVRTETASMEKMRERQNRLLVGERDCEQEPKGCWGTDSQLLCYINLVPVAFSVCADSIANWVLLCGRTTLSFVIYSIDQIVMAVVELTSSGSRTHKAVAHGSHYVHRVHCKYVFIELETEC